MKKLLLFLFILATISLQAQEKQKVDKPQKRNVSFEYRFPDNLRQTADSEERLNQWFRDAKFGAFIHFGVYSTLEGEYKGRGSEHRYSEWIRFSAKIPANEYHEVALLLCDNKSLPLGRTPNGDLLTNAAFYSFNSRTMTSITDPELNGAEELTGAEIVLRNNVWKYRTFIVSKVEGHVVSFHNGQKPTKKKGDENLQEAGYFFQKHLNTLDVDGEWYFDEKKHILYLCSEANPDTKSFQYSVNPIVVNIVNSKLASLQVSKIWRSI